jgi:hypothetical protein
MAADDTHPCAAPTCAAMVGAGLLACRRHWRRLPGDLRREVWRTWRRVLAGRNGAIALYEAARAEAVAWWEANP